MRIYLNVSCLNRPFDDLDQMRIRLESEAVTTILDQCESGDWTHVSSEIVEIEMGAMPDRRGYRRVRQLLPERSAILRLTPAVFQRAEDLVKLGFKAADAAHVSSAEAQGADILLSCDDRLCKLERKWASKLTVSIANPLDWLKEIKHATDT